MSADLAGPGPFLVDAYTDIVYLVVDFKPVIVYDSVVEVKFRVCLMLVSSFSIYVNV